MADYNPELQAKLDELEHELEVRFLRHLLPCSPQDHLPIAALG